MTLRAVMSSPPIIVSPKATIQQAAHLMAESGCGFLPIVEHGKAAGVVTGRDLATRVAALGLSFDGIPVSAVMSSPAIQLNVDLDIEAAGLLMLERDVRRLIVTEQDGTVVGVVGLSDLAGNVADKNIAKALRRHADAAFPGPSHPFVFSIPGLILE